MNFVELQSGKYILAVSGGVDSMVLLHMLQDTQDLELIVAHYDHGIREDSSEDLEFVRQIVGRYDLPFEHGIGKLGSGASEATARAARYDFLNSTKEKHGAQGVITAHHQDDLIETAILNIMRGTGHRGISAMQRNQQILRPLLGYSKQELLNYAEKNKLVWRDDPSNSDLKYTRNYIRAKLMSKLKDNREELVNKLDKVSKTSIKINKEIATLAQLIIIDNAIDRLLFIQLPHEVAAELLTFWLRENGIKQFSKAQIQRTTTFGKTAKNGSQYPLSGRFKLAIEGQKIVLSQTNL